VIRVLNAFQKFWDVTEPEPGSPLLTAGLAAHSGSTDDEENQVQWEKHVVTLPCLKKMKKVDSGSSCT